MAFTVEHNYRFDAAGKLDADDWVLVPRALLSPRLALDDTLADRMARRYFEIIAQSSNALLKIDTSAAGVRYQAPLGKTALIFAEPERVVDAQRAETSWHIAGGFMLAHRTSYGGRFYIGAEWQPPSAQNGAGSLKLYSSIRRYPSRLINWFGVNRGVAVYQQTQGRVHRRTQEQFLKEMASFVTQIQP